MKKPIKPLEEMLDSVRDIEGFPIGKDEDILVLSNPPYYTACPNPYINDFIEEYGKPYDEETDNYNREPFVGDVSEGKNDPVYNAHAYHTKVPYKAIMKYIKHYTDKGDIVFDGFCGTGMTGVAAQELNRKVIMSELSPIGTFISNYFNSGNKIIEFENEAKQILYKVEQECGWMYETIHTDGKTKGRINHIVWSDVFLCPFCNNEIIFFNATMDLEKKKIRDNILCLSCNAKMKKKDINRLFEKHLDNELGIEVEQAKIVPALINYNIGKKRFEKKPDNFDLQIIDRIKNTSIPYWYPINKIPNGYNTAQPLKSHGISHIHHFYTKRNIYVLSKLWDLICKSENSYCKFWFTSTLPWCGKENRLHIGNYFGRKGGVITSLRGTWYIASLSVETNVIYRFRLRIKSAQFYKEFNNNNFRISTQSAINLKNIEKDSIDYIFTDPPFGGNLMYSELNIAWESWIKVFTNNKTEAIINNVQSKKIEDYHELILLAFKEYYRILKPNRWITVEFHNSKSSIWNSIQDALSKSGFIIANVTILDKQKGSFKQVTSTGAVKNDLVISAYKPKEKFQRRFIETAGEGMEEEFIRMHLSHLPAEPSIERTEQMLYSKLLAFYVQRTYTVKYNSSSFYKMLRQHFVEDDGFWFNNNQLPSYHEYKKKMKLDGIEDIATGQQALFVFDEKSAIIWLYSFLNKPKTFQEIHPAFTKIATIINDKTPELMDILKENFIYENDTFRKPKSEDEKLSINEKREKALLREFEELLLEAKSSRKKIKECRKQAVLYGFEYCYKNERYRDILEVSNKMDKSILENDSELNEFVEVAQIKVEGY